MPFDPFPATQPDPDVEPFAYVRFNTEWRAFILGALQDTIDQAFNWAGSTSEIGLVLQQVDTLMQLISEDILTVPGNGIVVIHPYTWETGIGTWTKVHNGAIPYNETIINIPGANGNNVTNEVLLPAGDYRIRVVHAKFSTGGKQTLQLIGTAPATTLITVDSYAAATMQSQIASADFSLSEPYAGYLLLSVTDSPTSPGNTYDTAIHEVLINRRNV